MFRISEVIIELTRTELRPKLGITEKAQLGGVLGIFEIIKSASRLIVRNCS
jgi:hypothetical protein